MKLLHTVYKYGRKAKLESVSEDWFSPTTQASIYFLMTKAKLSDSQVPLSKVDLANLERLSNELSKKKLKAIIADQITVAADSLVAFSESVYVRAKVTTIMMHMLMGASKDIALKYLKKTIFDHNRNFRIQAQLLEKAAKLMVTSTLITMKDFTQKVLRDVALDHVTEKTFEHLKTSTLLNNLPLSDTVEIHEAKLKTTCFSTNA